ncbi:MAG TPA: hypothetical protein VMD05_08830 [Candidatus Nanoarchaeia archaeon]|nr:hypothetical protein [Candidatus Nanoarchaeia archaeon]
MTSETGQNKASGHLVQDILGPYLKLMGKIAGEKSNFKIDFQNVNLIINKTKVTLNGEINLDFNKASEDES